MAPKEASRKSGSVSRRSVWPVGAVSKTMREKCAYSGLFTNCTTCMHTPALVLSGPHDIYCLSDHTLHATYPQLHACAAVLPCMGLDRC